MILAAVVAAVVLVVAGTAAVLLTTGRSSSAVADAVGRTSTPPWPAPTDVEAQVERAGLTMLSAEGEALHIHQHLSVTVDGRTVLVPAGLGIDEGAQRLSAIHTHDTTGVIHVESPVVETFRLGQVFTEWDVRLGKGRVGGYQNGRGGVREVLYVDRAPYTGDPKRLALRPHQDIDFVITTDGSTPAAPASGYRFPAGY